MKNFIDQSHRQNHYGYLIAHNPQLLIQTFIISNKPWNCRGSQGIEY